MHAVFGLLPMLAAVLAVPQFVPQLLRVHRTDDTAGVSWSWAALTSLNNAAWFAYFVWSRFWTALVPASAATVLAGALAVRLVGHGRRVPLRSAMVVISWTCLLAFVAVVFGRSGIGTALTAAFVVQVAPSVWTAYRTPVATGISSAPGCSSSASCCAGVFSACTSPIRGSWSWARRA